MGAAGPSLQLRNHPLVWQLLYLVQQHTVSLLPSSTDGKMPYSTAHVRLSRQTSSAPGTPKFGVTVYCKESCRPVVYTSDSHRPVQRWFIHGSK